MLVDRFPVLSETFVLAEVRGLRAAGVDVRVEAVAHGPAGEPAVDEPFSAWEDETTGERLRAMAALAVRHPIGCVRDLASRRRWRREEPVPPLRMLAPAARRLAGRAGAPVHVHVHFAAGAALCARRIAAIAGVPWSVTAHAYDIYQRPANLAEKLGVAAFATSGCRYTVTELRRILGDSNYGNSLNGIHEVIMGIDGEAFRRRFPYLGGRFVLAVGRLVEKKGFGDLIDAVALMRDAGDPPDRVAIAGDGPLREALELRAVARGVDDIVEFAGAVPHDAVRALLERADVLCMPSVVAADGDRDSMPVVVKEALAMEVPVVATDEVGLPEVVQPGWGALVPPRHPPALATALRAELARPADERAARGRAGRRFVLERCDVEAEARKLAGLIERAATR
jgi:glycosyltransferase involved in cell wall biosynthesis